MTDISQNGWSVLSTAPPTASVPGTNARLRIRAGDVTVVLLEVATRFHHEVENLDLYKEGDEWGWAVRKVRGSHTVISNHASGTAIDLNATRHPRGVEDTFKKVQVAAIRTILASLFDTATRGPVVRWGGDFNSTADDMHFEIKGSPEAVKRVADRIRLKHAPVLAAVPKERDMQPTDKVTLTAAAARAMSLNGTTVYKEGDEVSWSYIWQWGGPGVYRDLHEAKELKTQVMAGNLAIAALTKQVAALTAVVAKLTIPTQRTQP